MGPPGPIAMREILRLDVTQHLFSNTYARKVDYGSQLSGGRYDTITIILSLVFLSINTQEYSELYTR